MFDLVLYVSGYITVARGGGDPHITTIDGRRYTFNGLGEYVLLRTTSSNFVFQGRTALAPNSDATIFSAFALGEGADQIEVINFIAHCMLKSSVIALIN